MIDWVTFEAPCRHSKRLTGGMLASIRSDGLIEWQKYKKQKVVGSWDSSIHVSTEDYGCSPNSRIVVSGNPAKWFQGHNLWGSDDLPNLVFALLDDLCSRSELGLCPTGHDRELWRCGAITLRRVDCTEMYHLRNRADVLAWLRAAEQTAYLAHRGRGQLVKGSTLYFGQRSRRWALKLYSKGQELDADSHGQSAVLQLPHAREFADRSLRAEMVVRGQELERRNLRTVRDWMLDDVDLSVTARLLSPVLGSMTMTTTSTLPADVLETLFPAQRAAYLAWVAGNDLRQVMPVRSFYRLRSKLLPHGIDIATVQPREKSNVVPLVRVLEAQPAGVPTWAQGTPLFFEPPCRVYRAA